MNTTEALSVDKTAVITAYEGAGKKSRSLLQNLFGAKTFIPDVKQRIRSFKDVLDDNKITLEAFEKSCKSLSPDEIAYKKLKLIAISLNEGWQPDFSDSSQLKYYPYFLFKTGFGFSYFDWTRSSSGTVIGARLCFKTSDLATYAGKQFEAIYNEYYSL